MPIPLTVTKADEKSNKVNSANWQEDVMLKKKILAINRTEKSIVHRITIEQKVLYKQFQTKLLRSKLVYARMMGDRESERILRARNIPGLNTDCERTENDYAFLKKLQYRPCLDYEDTLSSDKYVSNGGQLRNTRVKSSSLSRERQRSTLSCDSSFSCIHICDSSHPFGVSSAPVNVRPATSTGSRLEKKFNVCSDGAITNVSRKYIVVTGTAITNRENNSDSDLQKSTSRKSRVSFGDLRPHTCVPRFRKRAGKSPSELRRPSIVMLGQRTSLIDDEKKTNKDRQVEMMQTKILREKSIDYSPKVTKFIQSLNPLDNEISGQLSDYYLRRLESSLEKRPNKCNTLIPGTPEDEYNRFFGVRSLTMGKLNFDFQKTENGYINETGL